MTDLTDKWKKGELPDGYYYCKTVNGVEILRTWGDKYNQLLNNLDEVFMKEMSDCKIISEVPSYEEWDKLNWYAGNGVEENQELKMENTKLKTENKWYSEQLHSWVDRAGDLEELLKECRYKIIADLDDARLCESSVDIEDFEYLLDRINQALGEDK